MIQTLYQVILYHIFYFSIGHVLPCFCFSTLYISIKRKTFKTSQQLIELFSTEFLLCGRIYVYGF
nr:MAG TPA: hypothetical protein [Herelleviridae sp.]